VADPNTLHPLTYRTYRVNDLLQIWLLEGRDHRDPNTDPPRPDKTLWGEEQKAWLKETLLASDATFKILISPTPMIGPDDTHKGVQGGFLAPYFGGKPLGQGDDKTKRDNHLNTYSFKDEGDAFFDWLEENGFLEVTVRPPHGEEAATIELSFYDERGALLYRSLNTSP
jgi:alkaline phosphatase D